MDKKLKRKWLRALRSGNYKQGKEVLRSNNDEYCCLGVLVSIQGRRWHRDEYGWVIGTGSQRDWGGPDNAKLCSDVGSQQIAGRLAKMNDGGASFEQIADWIEDNL